MAPHIPNGKRLSGLKFHFSFLIAFLACFVTAASGQTPLACTTSSTNLMIRSEGITEAVGPLSLNCSGGTAGTALTFNITEILPALITNRLSAAGIPDAFLTVDTGSGPVSSGVPMLNQNSISFNNVSLVIPASRTFSIRIANVRISAVQSPVGQPIVPGLSTSNGISFTNSNPPVATPAVSLLSTYSSNGITCVGSPLPDTITLPNLYATGTRFFSTRLTEGFGDSFIVKSSITDSGTRFQINYTGFPPGSQLFVPDFVAGNNTTQPTSGGDLGGTQSGGTYTPGVARSLLLARVGANNLPIATAASISAATPFNSASPVILTAGAGSAVYEVIDSNGSQIESAQFPTFLGLPGSPNQTPVVAGSTVSLAAPSTIVAPTAIDPVPRFIAQTPPNDCQALSDCSASYFPVLSVGTTPLQFTAASGGRFQTQFVQVNNTGGGLLLFTASIDYQSGTAWLNVTPNSGSNHGTLQVDVNPLMLQPGIYGATITVNGGSAGSKIIPVSLTVTGPTITVTSVVNAASFQSGPLVAGSLATVFGQNFGGKAVSVTFDGMPAPILFNNLTQINLQVPAALASKTSSQIIVTVDGFSSTSQRAALAIAAPGVFGTLNQNYTVNSATQPAKIGSIVSIYGTGITSGSSGAVSVRYNGGPDTIPQYAGQAPGFPGVQQVNAFVPLNLTPGQVSFTVCTLAGTTTVCSPASTLTVN